MLLSDQTLPRRLSIYRVPLVVTMLVLFVALGDHHCFIARFISLPSHQQRCIGVAKESDMSCVFPFVTRSLRRPVAVCALGAFAGAALSWHALGPSGESGPSPFRARWPSLRSRPSPSPDVAVVHCRAPAETTPQQPCQKRPFVDIAPAIFAHISEEYDALGQVAIDEVALTVAPTVFAQIGVITPAGITAMAATAVGSPPLGPDDCFVDLGSGVGNVVLQVLCDTPVASAVGIEVLPSRHRHAEEAFANALRLFPAEFEGKAAHFALTDIVACAPTLRDRRASVLFTHSWMFDDALMEQLAALCAELPQLRCVVTSRPLPGAEMLLPSFAPPEQMSFQADWNEASPFFVYRRRLDAAANDCAK